MMIRSNLIFIQLYIAVLFMVTCTTTTKVSQSVEEASQSYPNQQHPVPILTNHHYHPTKGDSKQAVVDEEDDDDDDDLNSSSSNEEYIDDIPRHHHNQANWPDAMGKHYPKKTIRAGHSTASGGDNRLWAIPYRFGRRAAMPYRFGKRAGMHFRLGKKSANS